MIVLGADTHKSSHTIAAVDTSTGQVLGDKTVAVGARGFAALVIWARGFDGERMWALEDCRHVSGALERFLIARVERVVRVSTRLMAGTRRSSRERGKSGQIDATSVARAALAAGIETLPTAALAVGPSQVVQRGEAGDRALVAEGAVGSAMVVGPEPAVKACGAFLA
jgi:transposase